MKGKEGMEVGISWGLTALTTVLTALGSSDVGGWVTVIVSIISGIASIVYTVLRIVKWFKEAKADGKVTSEEMDELIEIVKPDKENENGHQEDSK